jgi:hypothetical protein
VLRGFSLPGCLVLSGTMTTGVAQKALLSKAGTLARKDPHRGPQRDAAPTELGLVLNSIAIEMALLTELDPAPRDRSERVPTAVL